MQTLHHMCCYRVLLQNVAHEHLMKLTATWFEVRAYLQVMVVATFPFCIAVGDLHTLHCRAEL